MSGINMCVQHLRRSLPLYYRQPATRSLRQYLSTAEETKESEGGIKTEDKTSVENTLQQDMEKLSLKLADVEDKYKRALAETENLRVRMNKQVADAKQFGLQSFCKDLLTVADVLSAATESVPQDQLTNANKPLVTMYEGLSQTDRLLRDVFGRHGLAAIQPQVGEKFDPHLHEAQFQAEPTEGALPGSVSACLQVGWRLHDRTLRPARVGVVKA